jgi:hypothetical protein
MWVSQALQILDRIGSELLCLCIPGLIFPLNGIRIIKKKQTISVGRGIDFSWKKPVMVYGKNAVRDGGCGVTFGLWLLIMGILLIIGILQWG